MSTTHGSIVLLRDDASGNSGAFQNSCSVGGVITAVALHEVSLKPVVCVDLVVEGLHFDEPGCLIQPPGLGQRAIRLQSQGAHATGLRFLGKLVENAPAK